MRLLVLSGCWPTQANPISGIFVAQQVAAFVRAGCDVRVVCIGNTFHRPSFFSCDLGRNGKDRSLIPQEVRVNNLPEQLFWLPGSMAFNVSLTGRAIAAYLKDIQRSWRPNAVLVHGMRYLGFSVPYWRQMIDGKVVQVIHGVDRRLSNGHAGKQFDAWVANSAACLDSTVIVGTPLLSHAAGLGIADVRLVSNGTDIPPLSTIDFSQRALPAPRILLSVSNLDSIKGIDLNLLALSRIAQKLPGLEWEYRIVGDGAERTRLEALKIELGIAERVRFLGRLEYAETMSEMANCDVFCLPSWGEAFGIVYIEAMARGRPVVGCWRNGAQDIVTHESDGLLVEPKNVDSLSEALGQLLSDPDACSRLGRRARLTAERFSWDSNVRNMLGILGLPDN